MSGVEQSSIDPLRGANALIGELYDVNAKLSNRVDELERELVAARTDLAAKSLECDNIRRALNGTMRGPLDR